MADTFRETLSQDLVTHIAAICGSRGEAWFDELPEIVRKLESEWNLTVRDSFPGIEYNFVAPATMSDGREVVVKIAPPFERIEIYGEAKYLRTLDGDGAVRLVAENREMRAIVIERAIPGESLFEKFAERPIECVGPAIDVLKTILRPPPDDMTDVDTLDNWFDNFRRYTETDFPPDRAAKALAIYERLSTQPGHNCYLHGDYHLGNVVTAERAEFLAIDPKGIAGHVGYDIAVFLINLHRWQEKNDDVARLIANAIAQFAKAFDMTEKEIREWTFATMVIGAWWNFDDMPELYDATVAMPDIWHL
jgi:streptomycin 6-kinase